jgi:hypothetical protein
MRPEQQAALMARVRELWPKCAWTPTQEDAFLDGVGNLAVEDAQWRACVDEVWRTSKWQQPDQDTLTARLRELSRANRTAPAVGAESNRQRGWRETPEETAAFDRGVAEARAWAEGASGEEISAARAELERRSGGWLRCPPTTRKELLANPGRCVSLYAAHRAGCREATVRAYPREERRA